MCFGPGHLVFECLVWREISKLWSWGTGAFGYCSSKGRAAHLWGCKIQCLSVARRLGLSQGGFPIEKQLGVWYQPTSMLFVSSHVPWSSSLLQFRRIWWFVVGAVLILWFSVQPNPDVKAMFLALLIPSGGFWFWWFGVCCRLHIWFAKYLDRAEAPYWDYVDFITRWSATIRCMCWIWVCSLEQMAVHCALHALEVGICKYTCAIRLVKVCKHALSHLSNGVSMILGWHLSMLNFLVQQISLFSNSWTWPSETSNSFADWRGLRALNLLSLQGWCLDCAVLGGIVQLIGWLGGFAFVFWNCPACAMCAASVACVHVLR